MEKPEQTAKIRDMVYHIIKSDYAKAHTTLSEVVHGKNQVRYSLIEQRTLSEINK